jgi:ABC-2 type transport system permease protein
MTSSALDRPAATTDPHDHVSRQPQLSGLGLLRSEWTKFHSLRSLVTVLAAGAAVLVLVGLVFAAVLGGVVTGASDEAATFADNPIGASLQGINLAQLVVAVLGVLIITSEYASGTIRMTMTAAPHRLGVLVAKAVLIVLVVFPLMLASAMTTFLIGQSLIGSGEVANASLGSPGALRAVVGVAAYLTAVTLIGLGVGTLLRSSAGGISVMILGVFALPELGALLLPSSWADAVLRYLPSNAGQALTSLQPSPDLLAPSTGALVLVGWVVIPLIVAAVALRLRDA